MNQLSQLDHSRDQSLNLLYQDLPNITGQDSRNYLDSYNSQKVETVANLNDNDNQDQEYTEVFSWGSDQAGQLGLGLFPIGKCYNIPRYCTYNIAIKVVACGDEHAAFITTNNLVYTMGSNSNGQLGVNDKSIQQKNSPILVESLMDIQPIDISCGQAHTVICTEEGNAYSWGQSKNGALGILNINEDIYGPIQVRFQQSKQPKIVQVSCGSQHTGFVDSQGRVFLCGIGDSGQLGLGIRKQLNEPHHLSNFTEKVRMVSCGQYHTLLLTSTGLVYSCGGNSFGQLGLGNRSSQIQPTLIKDVSHIPMKYISAGSFSASISKESNQLYLWGSASFGEFLTPHRVKSIKGQVNNVSIGNQFGVAVTKKGQVYSWGENQNGELGLSDYNLKQTPTLIKSLAEKIITQANCGRNFVISLGRTLRKGEIIKRPAHTQSNSFIDKQFPQGSKFNYEEFLNNSVDQYSKSKIKSNGKKKSSRKNTTSKQQNQSFSNENLTNNLKDQEYTPLRHSPVRSKSQLTKREQKQSHYHSNCVHPQNTTPFEPKITHKNKSKSRSKKVSKDYSGALQTYHIQELNSQLETQENIIQQLREQSRQDRNLIKSLKSENASTEDQLWNEKCENQQLQNEVSDLKQQLRDAISINDDLRQQVFELEKYKEDSYRLRHLEDQQVRQTQLVTDLERQNLILQEQLRDYQKSESNYKTNYNELYTDKQHLQSRISQLKQELDNQRNINAKNQQMMDSYNANLSDLEQQFGKREQEFMDLRTKNQYLQDQLERERATVNSLQKEQSGSLQERHLRQQLESDLEQLKSDFHKRESDLLLQNEQLKRNLQDLKYQNEENIRLITSKEEEINSCRYEINNLNQANYNQEKQIEELNEVIKDLEDKNRKLNDKINDIIYNKASSYKQRTMQALRMSQSPERKERIQQFGIQNSNDDRLDQAIEDEQMTTQKVAQDLQNQLSKHESPNRQHENEAFENYKLYKELDKIQNQSPLKTDDDVSPIPKHEFTTSGYKSQQIGTLKREDLSASRPQAQFTQPFNVQDRQMLQDQTEHTYKRNNQSPLRSKDNTSQKRISPTKHDKYPKNYHIQNQDDILPSSFEKSRQSQFQNEYSNKYDNTVGDSFAYRDNNSNTDKKSNATQLTSSMIKKSLHDLRAKLDNMKKDNNVLESGISEYERRSSQ